MPLFRRGGGGRVNDAMEGSWRGADVRLLSLAWHTAKTNQDEHWWLGLTPINARTSPLHIGQVPPDDRSIDELGLDRVTFELDDFNRQWLVYAADPAVATAIIDQQMISWLMSSHPQWDYEVADGWLMVMREDLRASPSQYDLEPVLEALLACRDQSPARRTRCSARGTRRRHLSRRSRSPCASASQRHVRKEDVVATLDELARLVGGRLNRHPRSADTISVRRWIASGSLLLSAAVCAVTMPVATVGATAPTGDDSASVAGACGEGLMAVGDGSCTHGGDHAPRGLDRLAANATTAGSPETQPCVGDGVSGRRILVYYGYPSDTTPNASAYRASIRESVAIADASLDAQTPGATGQHLRVTCRNDERVAVRTIALLPIGEDGSYTFDDVIHSFLHRVEHGLGDKDIDTPRLTYVVFVDNIACCYGPYGQSTIYWDDRADPIGTSTTGWGLARGSR